ncbi:MAG: DUF4625 domain-containing protein [Acidobacteriota bacterium]|nr:DUF4625 domain-containing protein [Acidobacteriota bacterium]
MAQTRSMSSKHVTLQFPAEREILGRELSAEAERCYDYMNRAMDGGLPRNITVALDWNASGSTWNFRTGRVMIGMDHPASSSDAKKFLNHALPLGIARLGLINLSQGGQREDTEFLFEGMSEILAHEYNHSTRTLDAAWAIARLLDEEGLLGLAQQRIWSEFSGGRQSHRNAAPGITFLLIQREIDRTRPVKFFSALKKNSLLNALNTAFKTTAAELEAAWLKRVREYEIPDEIVVQAGEGPKVTGVDFSEGGADGARAVHLTLKIDGLAGGFRAENIFVRDLRSGKAFPARNAPGIASSDGVATAGGSAQEFVATIPVAADVPAGRYEYQVVVIDEAGNLGQTMRSYELK